MGIIFRCFTFLISMLVFLPQIIAPTKQADTEASFFENWSKEDEFTKDYAVTLKKNPNKDFVVLNLTDIQLSDGEYILGVYAKTEAMIKRLVKETEPDLITLSGDNAWSTFTYIKLTELMESFNIPWAPVMGNHDGEHCPSEFWCTQLFYTAKNCVWKYGPKDMGYGNYIINIEENDRIIHTIFMMDTHNNNTFTLENGETVSGYDHLWQNQIEWYEWAVNGIKDIEGKTVESTAIMHIPVYQLYKIWLDNYDKENHVFLGDAKNYCHGLMYEKPGSSPVDNGFFDKAVELGSTKNMIFGHDHINDASFEIDGIKLLYSLKTGPGTYYEKGLLGGTTLTINSDGTGTAKHQYYDEFYYLTIKSAC